MKTISTQDRQTLFDVALQHCGDVSVAFEIAELNDVSISDTLAVGTVLVVPKIQSMTAQRIVNEYALGKHIPATDATEIPNRKAIKTIAGKQLRTIDGQIINTIL